MIGRAQIMLHTGVIIFYKATITGTFKSVCLAATCFVK